MTENEKIKRGFERTVKALSLKPSLGLSSGISKTKIKNGLTCETTEGNWKLITDMPESVGGNSAGPSPGVYGRAALGSCLAIGYMMRAAVLEISVNSLEVEIKADYDDGALFGTSSADPGYLEINYSITIETDAPPEKILRMLDDADLHSPYLDVFSRAQKCHRDVHIISPKPA
jgi:uncharacterized OsmC-like protein